MDDAGRTLGQDIVRRLATNRRSPPTFKTSRLECTFSPRAPNNTGLLFTCTTPQDAAPPQATATATPLPYPSANAQSVGIAWIVGIIIIVVVSGVCLGLLLRAYMTRRKAADAQKAECQQQQYESINTGDESVTAAT